MLAKQIAESSQVIGAAIANNSAKIIEETREQIIALKSNVDFVRIVDNKGLVLARTDDNLIGDSILTEADIREALNGVGGSYIESTTTVQFGLFSSIPILNESGQIIGAVSAGYRLDTPQIADTFGELTGSEVTVFKGDTRVTTTIVDEGGIRQINTTLTPAYVERLLVKGESISQKTELFGEEYIANYEPIFAKDGTAIGILFLGKSMEYANSVMNKNWVISTIYIVFLSVIGAIVITLYVRKNFTKR